MKKIKKIRLAKLIAVIIMLIVALNIIYNKNQKHKTTTIDAELARMMTYRQYAEDDFKTYNDYVSFGAFFLRDLDGDGYAEKIAGTSKEIGKTDTLYMNLNVSTQGYIKDGKIKILGKNFKLQTAIVKDSVVKNNAIGLDTTEIQLNDVYPGTTKLLMGTLKEKIQSTADYSQINQIIFTATYVDENQNETPIEKTIDLTVDWYGDVSTQITTNTETIYANECMDEEEGTIDLKFKVTTQETKKQLILTENNVKLTIPELNGYKPMNVVLEGSNGEVVYNEETGEFEITRTGSDLPITNTYTIIVTYPIEAYTTLGEETASILIPVESYHIGANNPNKEFENPQISETATKNITLVIEKEKEEISQDPKVSATIGKYVTTPNVRYVISKKLPMKRYAGEVIEENTEYTVQWKAETGTEALKGIKLEQTSEDKIYDNSTGTEISMTELTKYTGIYIVSAEAVVGQDGYINVINAETDEIIHTFTSSDWNTYTSSNPYKYETSLKNIRIETSSTLPGTTLMAYNIKKIDDETLIKTYDEEEFLNLTKINTYLTGTIVKETDTVLNVTNTADYEEETSKVSIALSKKEISTQEEEKNQLITIEAQTQEYNTAKWINGQFVVKFPPDIVLVEINEIKISDATVKILGHELYEEDGNYFIKIVTENETETGYQITIDCNIHVDPRISTTSYEVELYAINENCETYQTGNSAEDIYDVNADTNTTEIVAYSTTPLKLVAPGSLTTSQVASEYDDFGSTTLAPQIAEITPEAIINSSGQNPQIAVQIRNNYVGTVSEVLILGKIPFKGNNDGITGNDLGSTYTTIMKSEGLSIPENLQEEVTIYYSSYENPTTDLNNTKNGWTTTPEDWSQVKTYLIDFGDYVLSSKEECVFIYEIEIPDDVKYNEVSYSTHKVEFYLDTENGKLYQEIEPRKLGFRIAKKYDLELMKYKKGTVEPLQGITFKLTELDENGEEADSRIRTTDENGVLYIEGLYVEKTYILKEIKTLSEYDLNKEKIKFIATVDENGELVITVLEGAFKDDKIEITQATETGKNPVVHVAIENEVKYNLVINKTDAKTSEVIKGVRFELENGKTRKLTTNSNGQINLKGLSIGQEYTLTETEAEGYYLIEPIKFILTRNNDNTLNFTLTHENGENVKYEFEETVEGTVCPRLTLNIKNTPIPQYSMNVLKVSKQTNIQTGSTTTDSTVKKLEGAQFELYSKDLDTTKIYTTDAEGNISLEGLYEYVDGKEVTGEYTLKEIYAPEGHALNDAQMFFRAQRNTEGNLALVILSGQDLIADTTDSITGIVYDSAGVEITTKNVTIENPETDSPTIGITVENESIFSIEKRDKDTGELLEGAKFTIYEIDENYEIIGNAKDVEGNILGTLETIDGQEYYILTTNQSGQITAQIGEGFYKAVEVAVPEGYILDSDEANRTYFFGIGKSKPAERETSELYTTNLNEENSIIEIDSVNTDDGGYISLGTMSVIGDCFIDGSKTVTGESIHFVGMAQHYKMLVLLKYNSHNKIEWAEKVNYLTGFSEKYLRINANGDYIVYDTSTIFVFDGKNKTDTFKRYGYSGNGFTISNQDEYYQTGNLISNVTIPAEETVNGEDIIINYLGSNYTYLMKRNSEGKVEWVLYPEIRMDFDEIVYTNDNKLLIITSIAANTTIPGKYMQDGEDYITTAFAGVIKLDLDGKIEKVYESSVVNARSDYIITTQEYGFMLIYNGYIVKYNSLDELVYKKKTFNMGTTKKMIETSDNGFLTISNYTSNSQTSTILAEYTKEGTDIILENKGNQDGIVIKWTSDGLIEWAKNISSTAIDQVTDILELEDGKYRVKANVEALTTIPAEETVDNTEKTIFGSTTLIYNREGLIEYVDTEYSSTHQYTGVAPVDDGGSIAVGNFEGKVELSENQTTNNTEIEVYSNGKNDALIVKYNEEGKIEWVNSIGSSGVDKFNAIAKVGDGYIAVGQYERTLTIEGTKTKSGESIILNNTNTYSNGLIVKYDIDGLVEWAKYIGGTGADSIEKIAATDIGEYIIVGTARRNIKNTRGRYS